MKLANPRSPKKRPARVRGTERTFQHGDLSINIDETHVIDMFNPQKGIRKTGSLMVVATFFEFDANGFQHSRSPFGRPEFRTVAEAQAWVERNLGIECSWRPSKHLWGKVETFVTNAQDVVPAKPKGKPMKRRSRA